MAKNFLRLGLLLIVLGIVSYVRSGAASVTALIPAFFGVMIGILAIFGQRSDRPLRWNFAAAALAVLGFAGSLRGLLQLPDLISGADVARPAAVAAQAAMSLICLAFLVPFAAKLLSGRRDELRRS